MRENILRLRTTRGKLRLEVYGGLYYIKGNSAPYFSLTGATWALHNGQWREDSAGCIHETILKWYPELADLATLHLSSIDGAPSYALENGFYFLEGGQYVGGMGGYRLPCFDRDNSWERRRAVVARHFRVSEDVVQNELLPLLGEGYSASAGFLGRGYREAAKARVAAWIDGMRDAWQREAFACIEKHGLTVYGDPWKPAN